MGRCEAGSKLRQLGRRGGEEERALTLTMLDMLKKLGGFGLRVRLFESEEEWVMEREEGRRPAPLSPLKASAHRPLEVRDARAARE